MNKLTLLFGVLLCLVVVNARHYGERDDESLENEEETLKRPRERNAQARHRRRRWQMNYGYDYPPPSYYYPDRRDSERNNQEQVLQHISQLLEELTAYIRRPPPPPPPPQPIYIPYPVHLNYPRLRCRPLKKNETTPNVDSRNDFLKDMDQNRIWGLVVSNENDYDDGSDFSRPISFDPIVPKQPMNRPTPKVDHGSVQASAQSTQAPRFADDAPGSFRVAAPGMCNAAILSCCGIDQTKQQQCFETMNCGSLYAEGTTCQPQNIQNALKSFQLAYAPLN